jgi:hypothetical protein
MELLMKTKDYTCLLIINIIFAVGLGFLSLQGCKLKSDSAVEEIAETVIEDVAEAELHLPEGSLKDKIDLTPWSPEPKK